MIKNRTVALYIGLATALFLSACESVEEKAQSRYLEAAELAEDGQNERAAVVLRNVFKLDGEHRDARMLFASIMRDQGDIEQAFKHYRLVTEQYPDFTPARSALARLAVNAGGWDIAREQVEAVGADVPEMKPIAAVVEYVDAVQNDDAAAEAKALEKVSDLLEQSPDDALLARVVIDALTRQQKYSAALDQVNLALEVEPNNVEFNQLKLNLLARLEDVDALGEHLKVMVERFPENSEIRTALVRWYLSNDDADGAEAFVRDVVAKSGDAIPPRLGLVQFLAQVRGIDAAVAELDAMIEEGLDDSTFRLYRATLMFDDGQRDAALEQVSALLEGREPSDETRDIQTTFARMLVATGEDERAEALVEEVLAQDSSNVEALKLKASWLIQQDRVRDAVLALRTALDQAPSDADAVTLMAQAYERGGNRELMAESLSRAVDVSNAAPEEAIRYARFLVQTDKLLAAEDTLLRAIRLAPADLRLLRLLGQIYLEMNELPRAEQVVASIRQIQSEEAQSLANGFQAAILQRLQRTDESIELMQRMANDGQSALGAKTAIIRTRLANGEVQEARNYMNTILAETPDDGPDRIGVDFLNAALTATEGDFEAAQAMYRDILAQEPQIEAVWRALIATTAREGNPSEALAITNEALAAIPDAVNIKWIKAGLAEQVGEIDTAVDIYEELYTRDSSSTVIANNLASLITTYRDDEESLQRAFLIARRLRGSEVPAFQDTYGWIAYRLGNYDDALDHLEPAAEGLPNDPNVQYHLAKTYEALERYDDAVPYYERALGLWDDTTRDRAELARAEYDAMLARQDAPAEDEASESVPATD